MTKLIEALKKTKELTIKAEDLRGKVSKHCAIPSNESAVYGADKQKLQIDEWIQAHSDVLKEILRLRIAIQKTNLATNVDIQLGGKTVTKTIAEWIHRRKDLSSIENSMWNSIGDRNIQEGTRTNSTGEKYEVKIVRFYDPKTRDEKVELFRTESGVIDRTLEVTNAITDLIE
jgi:hypothetical protein